MVWFGFLFEFIEVSGHMLLNVFIMFLKSAPYILK